MPQHARLIHAHRLAMVALLTLSPGACAQTTTSPPSDTPPGQTPEQPKGDLGEAAEVAEIVAQQSDAELQALLDALEQVDLETDSMRASLYHVTENFVTGLKEARTGTLTLRTDRDDEHPSGLALRRFRVDIHSLIFDGQKHDEATSYIFDGTWLAERIEDEKQYNKWQLVRPGERFDPMDKMQGSAIWLPIGLEVDRLQRDYDAALVPASEFFDGEPMGQTLADVTNAGEGSVQLRLRPRDANDPIEEIRLWFDAASYLPRAHAVLDGEGLQVSTLFGVQQNPGDVDATLFDTTDPPAREGWDVTARPWRGGE